MRLRTVAIVAVAAAGGAVWWRRRRLAPAALQLGLADGSVHALATSEADVEQLRGLAAELRRASLEDG